MEQIDISFIEQIYIGGSYPFILTLIKKQKHFTDRKAVMGFPGKNLAAAEYMLADANERNTARAEEQRKKALLIVSSFIRLPVSPHAGEGFNLDNAEVALAIPNSARLLLFIIPLAFIGFYAKNRIRKKEAE